MPVILALLLATLVGGSALAADPEAPAPAPETSPPPLPETVVVGEALREEQRVGPNRQPEWTARRRFATTRVYVLPPWQLSAETSWRVTKPRQDGEEGGDVEHQLTQEMELGLPYRLQLDYEASGGTDPEEDGDWRFQSQAVELRWALADWDVIPLNPTLFGEWKFRKHEADSYEIKLLLGEEIAARWHTGLNLFFEQQVGDQREREIAASGAVSYAIVDSCLSAGVEMEYSAEREEAEEAADYEHKFLLGPSVQWRPLRRLHVDVVPLFGATHASPVVEAFVFVGFDFGKEAEREGEVPGSMRTR